MSKPGITRGINTWKMQDNYVERLMDNSAFTSAHPDDTLVLAGPARYQVSGAGSQSFAESLLPIGMLQNFTVSQNKAINPLMSIGSGRQFFLAGKAQTGWNVSRLFVNGRNLLRVLHTQAVQAGVDVSTFDDAAASSQYSQFFGNLDSELFYVPFGLAVLFRDKIHHQIAAFYIELCMISSWNIAFSAGQSFIAEGVNGVADRIVPMGTYTGGTAGQSDSQKSLSPDVLGLATSDDDLTIFGDLTKR